MASEDGDALWALLQEYFAYHSSVYLNLARRLDGDSLGDYLGEFGGIIARSSRVLEPFIKGFAASLLEGVGPMRILEIGCGTGIYLRHASEANPQATGMGVDIQKAAVELARANLAKWGIGDRFEVAHGDIRDSSLRLDGPFDLITSYQNIYYFNARDYPF